MTAQVDRHRVAPGQIGVQLAFSPGPGFIHHRFVGLARARIVGQLHGGRTAQARLNVAIADIAHGRVRPR